MQGDETHDLVIRWRWLYIKARGWVAGAIIAVIALLSLYLYSR